MFFAWPCVSQEDVQSKIKYHTEKAQNYLDKEKALSGFYSIDKDGIKMYASQTDKTNHKIEFQIEWKDFYLLQIMSRTASSEALMKTYKTGKPTPIIQDGVYIDYSRSEKKLHGLKIAIDPGHIANDFIMGDLEKKHIIIKGDSLNGITDSIEIAEGMLTYATAILLKMPNEKVLLSKWI